MKPLLIWLAVVAVVFGAFALITSLTRDTEQVFVVVDSSFQMQPVWRAVPGELDRIDDEEHAEFALATEKEFVHSWQSHLDLAGVDAYAPCTFDGIADSAEAQQADKRILITTPIPADVEAPEGCDTTNLTDWEIIYLEP